MSLAVHTAGGVSFELRETCVGDALDAAAARWKDRRGWSFDEVGVTFG